MEERVKSKKLDSWIYKHLVRVLMKKDQPEFDNPNYEIDLSKNENQDLLLSMCPAYGQIIKILPFDDIAYEGGRYSGGYYLTKDTHATSTSH